MSSSDVRRTANSNAKFGAADHEWLLVASNCIHRAGFCRNDTGLISTATSGRTLPRAGEQRPEHALYQSHVVVEGQPRHHSGVLRRYFAPDVVGEHWPTLAMTLLCETITPAG